MKDNNILPWLLGSLCALAVFALCFVAIDYVGRPDGPDEPDIEEVDIATVQTNPELIALARSQGWIAADATAMTSVDAAQVHELGTALQGSDLRHFHEFRHFLGIRELPAQTFAGSAALQSVTIPRNVVSIDYGALADCPSLTEIRVDTANTHYDSRHDCNAIVCTWKGKLMIVAGCRTTRVPDAVRYIAPQAFRGARGLTEIALPERMNEMGEEAFRDCRDLAAFSVPQGVRFVEAGTFSGCTALHTVTLPKSVERLRKNSFGRCTALQRIVCIKQHPPIVEGAFDDYSATVVVPKGLRDKYCSNKYWKDFATVVEE